MRIPFRQISDFMVEIIGFEPISIEVSFFTATVIMFFKKPKNIKKSELKFTEYRNRTDDFKYPKHLRINHYTNSIEVRLSSAIGFYVSII